jgi:hypothetical protein
MEETRQILKYIDSPEGVTHQVKEGFFALAKLKTILYRPLWIAAIALIAAGGYYVSKQPRQLDIEIDSIVKTAPVNTLAVSTGPGAETNMTPTAPAPEPERVSAPVIEPLAVSITPADDIAAVRRINEVMGAHGQLRKMKFSDNERELSGNLTAKELLVLFSRIEPVAKVRYSRKRFEALPAARQIPFVLTLKAASKANGKPLSSQKPETRAPANTNVSVQQEAVPPQQSSPADGKPEFPEQR